MPYYCHSFECIESTLVSYSLYHTLHYTLLYTATMSAFQQALASAASSSNQQQGSSSSSLSIRGSATGGPSARGLTSALRGIKKDGTPGMEVDGASNSGRSVRGSASGRRATIGSTGYIPNQVSYAIQLHTTSQEERGWTTGIWNMKHRHVVHFPSHGASARASSERQDTCYIAVFASSSYSSSYPSSYPPSIPPFDYSHHCYLLSSQSWTPRWIWTLSCPAYSLHL